MNTKFIKVFILLGILISASATSAQSTYKITLLQAAPGQLLTLIEAIEAKSKQYEELGGARIYTVRHSQGDFWDLMIYEYIGTLADYFKADPGMNKIFTPPFGDDFYELTAHHESIFVNGPDHNTVDKLLREMNYFHVEMFNSLPGKQSELLKQRNMENVYLKELGRQPNLIFTVNFGANWDCFTLGGYRDIKHYAASADISPEVEEKAAIKAGFEGVRHISPYLRSLIYRHHDTLGGKL